MTIYPLYRGRAPALASWPEFLIIGVACWLVISGDESTARALASGWNWLALALWLVPVLVLEPPARVHPPLSKVIALGCSFGFLVLGGLVGPAAFYQIALGAALISVFSAPSSFVWIIGLVSWLPLAEPAWRLADWTGAGTGAMRVGLAAMVSLWALRKTWARRAPPPPDRAVEEQEQYAA